MEKFLENLEEAEKIIITADHLIYVTYSLIKDKKLFLKILTEINRAIIKSITAMLQYEYLYKRITLYKDSKTNLETFKTKSAARYNISPEEIKKILELMNLVDEHEKSTMEFVKDDKVIILAKDMKSSTLNLEKLKEFINLAKSILNKVRKILLTRN